MREINFRAWDKQTNSWLKADFWFVRSSDAVLVIWPKYEGVASQIVVKMETLGSDCVVVTQYTGLRDKNGVEIYEGDLVDWDYGHWNECTGIDHDNPEVQKGCAQHRNDIEEVVFTEGQFVPVCWADDAESTRPPLSQCKVIGNIYENPELLN